MESRHAYCIIAHNEIDIFKILINLIDDVRNDIFVFLDKRTDLSLFSSVKPKYSNIHFVKDRHKVYWAGYSLTLAEIKTLELAHECGKFSYYHLISGVDLPIKTQDYIHEFFNKNAGKEFIGIIDECSSSVIQKRTNYYYPFQNNLSTIRGSRLGRMIAKLQNRFIKVQKFFKIKRKYSMPLRMGPNWFSVTNKFVEYLLLHKVLLEKEFGHIFISDEIAIQSIFWNSPFRDNRYCSFDEYKSCLRKIDWKRGMPYTWTINDIEELMASEHIFARKFSSDSFDVVKEIEKRLTMNK